MGEKETKPFQLTFNGLLKVDFQGSHVTSDGGLILVRELDERLGFGELIDEHLSDSRQGTNKQFTLADLLRQSVYSRLAGYEDLNDAARVSIDPTFRLIGSQKIWDRGAALTSTLHSFETEMLASEENLLGLMALNRELLAQAETQDNSERVVLDMDSTESPVHGQQEGSAYNGHFEWSRSPVFRKGGSELQDLPDQANETQAPTISPSTRKEPHPVAGRRPAAQDRRFRPGRLRCARLGGVPLRARRSRVGRADPSRTPRPRRAGWCRSTPCRGR